MNWINENNIFFLTIDHLIKYL